MKIPFLPALIGTGLGAGYSPVAPGTVGALLATLFWYLLYVSFPYATAWWLTVALIVLCTAAGIWAANRLEVVWGEDPSRVVIDEMVGVWIPLLAVPVSGEWMWYALAAFVLFRAFDIGKPLGIRYMERLGGGVGVMMDDVLAGIYSLVLLMVVRWCIG